MTEQQQDAGEWFAGDAEGLDLDYAHVIRRWIRPPGKVRWGDVDYGESEPVAICTTAEDQSRILADHKAAKRVEELEAHLNIEVDKTTELQMRLAQAEEALVIARFAPVGDNHHNAAACPYCRSFFDDWEKRLEQAEADAKRLWEALEAIAEPKYSLRHDGESVTCLRCGFETFTIKDNQAQHEKDCVHIAAQAALKGDAP